MNDINLIPRYRIEARQRRSRIRAWAWGCAGYAAVMVAACAVAASVFGGGDRSTSGEMGRMERQLADTNRQLTLVRPEMDEARAQLDAGRAVTVQPDWGLLLKLLAQSRGDSVVLDRVALSPVEAPTVAEKIEATKPAAGGNIALAAAKKKRDAEKRKPLCVEIQISGLARTQLDVSQFVLRLEQIKLFDQVKLLDTSRAAPGESAVISFRLQCSMAEDLGGRKP